MKKIYGELSRIQKELKAPKNLYNSFGKYKYRNAEGILEAVKPMLNGYVLVINDEPVMVGDRIYIKATVTLTDGEESISATAYAREDAEKKGMDGCQLTGACSSYARKYALNALLMIDDSKDSDDDSLSPKNPANQNDNPQEKPFTRPENPAPAAVSTAKAINPVFDYIENEKKFMAERFGLSAPQMKAKFKEMRASLITGGIVKDIPADKLTMEDAKNLVEAMYVNFMTDNKKDYEVV